MPEEYMWDGKLVNSYLNQEETSNRTLTRSIRKSSLDLRSVDC